MRSLWIAVSVAALSVGCEKDAPKPAPKATPKPIPEASRPKPVDPDAPPPTLSVYVGEKGIMVGTTIGGDARRIAVCDHGGYDTFALDKVLVAFRKRPAFAHRDDIEISADEGVSYETVVFTMDAAISAGFHDVGLVDPASLSVKFGPGGKPVATACGKVAPARDDAPPVEQPAKPSKPADRPSSIDLPIVTISPTEVSLDGKRVMLVADVRATDAEVVAPIRDALSALPPADATELEKKRCSCPTDEHFDEARDECVAGPTPPLEGCRKGVLILQADRRTDASVINKVIKAANAAGYANIMFAVEKP